MTLLQTSYNMTKERDQIQTSYTHAIAEKYQLRDNLTKQTGKLQTTADQLQQPHYRERPVTKRNNKLTKDNDHLQTSYNHLNTSQNWLENLTKQRDQLQTGYNNVTKELDQLQSSYIRLVKEKDQIQTSYDNLVKEKDQIQTSYDNLVKEKDQIQTSYDNLAEEKDQIQTGHNSLKQERDQLQTSHNDLIRERHQLEGNLTRQIYQLQTGWVYFSGSLYQVSSTKKTWDQSRSDCRQKGADLLIINSEEEQAFANRFQKYMWIGLTDVTNEGSWKWVDGTAMSTSRTAGGRRNCVDIKNFNAEKSWNDESCSLSLLWICEKKLFQ
uniref:C-type lectin domain-containing protein n=1 Tax=Takifugu rubripes TaxID=31033 RepID=A0A674MMS6_TAKRU